MKHYTRYLLTTENSSVSYTFTEPCARLSSAWLEYIAFIPIGRVERLFGTLQDRLVIELRLAGASTREQANEVLQAYLPRFNAQFAVEPAQADLVYRPLPETQCLDTLVCSKYVRTVALDNTVNFGEHRLQLLPDQQ